MTTKHESNVSQPNIKSNQPWLKNIYATPVVKSFIAGTLSGTCSTVLFQPFDLVKTRLQKSVNIGSKLGMIAEFKNVIKNENVSGLWNGLIPSLWRCVPGIGLYFASLHWMKSTLGNTQTHPVESFLFGASARTIAGIVVLPFTVIKTRYESGDFKYNGIIHAIKFTYAKEGLQGLYSGLAPTLLRDVPFSGIYLMFYTQLKALSSNNVDTSSLINFTNGIIAGTFTSFITQPADVIKTNMQLYPLKYGRLKTVIPYIYSKCGLFGFWRGIIPRSLRRTLMSALSWTVYEEVMKVCDVKT
ncbi:mitochondrial glycine transporter A-like isoform X1 [Biomphalaria glabrata]|uniref:Mitochondrial glycine transporter n=2 Tax=Biomphalaria glabrata TaxID=6526 RepID=A0A9W2ZL01_BIOGL|nr:mitochondrial glycine transporter A-like isoform X1 [Biomphalaria glabrata]XP_055875665.1 mitochondrial glycine transporter A-like isoform X1 [Biomphalaria glabrata]XP_055875666.1 mitochondrial glycine transporter A-like isoform X1 [Biomphalaria glabrata]XP_055875667.1 mitochondrial glycine transporter A-like isoform X1 [Biomphalaria glabrata]